MFRYPTLLLVSLVFSFLIISMQKRAQRELTSWQKCSVSITPHCENHCHKSRPGTIRLIPTYIGQSTSINTLCLQCSKEEYVDSTHANVVYDLRGFGKICKPRDDLRRTAAHSKETQKGKYHGDAKAVDGNTGLGAFAEETWGVPIEREAV